MNDLQHTEGSEFLMVKFLEEILDTEITSVQQNLGSNFIFRGGEMIFVLPFHKSGLSHFQISVQLVSSGLLFRLQYFPTVDKMLYFAH